MKTNYPSKQDTGYSFVNGTIMMAQTDSIRTAAPFKNLFPIREDILNRIVTDMEQHGFDSGHPIVVWSGKKLTVVDGHTRLLAAIKLGIEAIPVVFREFANEKAALEYAIGSQRNRRNLTDAELMRCLSALDKRKKTGRPQKGDTVSGKSAERTAVLLGTSRSKVEKIRSINAHAAEDIKTAVLSGKLSVNKAYVVTMEKVNTDTFKTEAEKKKAFMVALEIDITKIIKTRIGLEQKRHPDFLLTGKEAAELLKKLSTMIKTELNNLTKKGNN